MRSAQCKAYTYVEEQAMDKITRLTIQSRVRDYTSTFYLQSALLIQNGVFVVAVATLLEIIQQQSGWDMTHLLFLWLASFAMCLIKLTTWPIGSLTTTSNLTLVDIVCTIIYGMAEFGFFATLSPKFSIYIKLHEAGLDLALLPRLWFAAVALHSGAAIVLVANRRKRGGVETFDSELSELALKYRVWTGASQVGAILVTLACVIIWMFSLFLSRESYWLYVDVAAAVALIGVAMKVSLVADMQFQEIRKEAFFTSDQNSE